MNPKFTYTRRNPNVQAVWWNGDNRDEVIEFFRDCGLPEDQGPYFSRDEGPDDEYNTVDFYDGDDESVDEKMWITWERWETWNGLREAYGQQTSHNFHYEFDVDLMS